MTARDNVWPANEPFQRDDYEAYLQTYRQSTRLRLVPTTAHDQMPAPSVTDMYPIEAIGGSRNYAVRTLFLLLNVCIKNHNKHFDYVLQAELVADIQTEVAAYAPLPQQTPWFRRLEEKLRRVYTVLTCTGGVDVAPHRAAPRPTRQSSLTRDVQVSPSHQSTHRQDPRPRLVLRPPARMYESGSSSQLPDRSHPGPSQPGPSQSGPSQPGPSQPDPSHSGPSQPHMFPYGVPPGYGYGMAPGYGLGMPSGYGLGMSSGYGVQQPAHMAWNQSAVPFTEDMGHLG